MRDLIDKEQIYYNVLERFINRMAHTRQEKIEMIEALDFLVGEIITHEENKTKELEVRLDELRRCFYRLGEKKA